MDVEHTKLIEEIAKDARDRFANTDCHFMNSIMSSGKTLSEIFVIDALTELYNALQKEKGGADNCNTLSG